MKGQTLTVVGLLLAALLGFTGCGRKTERAAGESLPVATVRAQITESKSRVATEDVVGTVRAKLHAVIEAKVSGKIEQMLVVPGQNVKAGELLAQLDAREVQAQLDQALALRQQAESDLETRHRPGSTENSFTIRIRQRSSEISRGRCCGIGSENTGGLYESHRAV